MEFYEHVIFSKGAREYSSTNSREYNSVGGSKHCPDEKDTQEDDLVKSANGAKSVLSAAGKSCGGENAGKTKSKTKEVHTEKLLRIPQKYDFLFNVDPVPMFNIGAIGCFVSNAEEKLPGFRENLFQYALTPPVNYVCCCFAKAAFSYGEQFVIGDDMKDMMYMHLAQHLGAETFERIAYKFRCAEIHAKLSKDVIDAFCSEIEHIAADYRANGCEISSVIAIRLHNAGKKLIEALGEDGRILSKTLSELSKSAAYILPGVIHEYCKYKFGKGFPMHAVENIISRMECTTSIFSDSDKAASKRIYYGNSELGMTSRTYVLEFLCAAPERLFRNIVSNCNSIHTRFELPDGDSRTWKNQGSFLSVTKDNKAFYDWLAENNPTVEELLWYWTSGMCRYLRFYITLPVFRHVSEKLEKGGIAMDATVLDVLKRTHGGIFRGYDCRTELEKFCGVVLDHFNTTTNRIIDRIF